jgi:hypothetical protein
VSDPQFYVLVAIPLLGILMNGGLFLHLGGRSDKLVEKVGERRRARRPSQVRF